MLEKKTWLFASGLLASIIPALATAGNPGVITPGQTGVIKVGKPIPGQYIVVFNKAAVTPQFAGERVDDLTEALGQRLASQLGVDIRSTWSSALQGMAISANAAQAEALSRDPNVAFVEEDGVVKANLTQTGAPWGLDRVDQRARPLDTFYNYSTTASNVSVYVIDTGIRTTHTQFGNRAISGYDAVDGALPADDCNGHGTHVAGTIGGSAYGIAKGVRLVAVRVLDCGGSGSNSQVIAGINWVTNQKIANPSIPMVANMSLGGGASSALDTAVQNSITKGITYVIAAGNSNANACNYSPARVGAALTVGATTSTDARASYSNWGSCLDLFAPGSSITSAWYTSNTALASLSGTSMASPHVAGGAALYLSVNPAATPAMVASALINKVTPNVVTNLGTGSPNRLLYTP